jgi:hypothetical protein
LPFQNLCNIHYLKLLAQTFGSDRIIEHQQAVWARSGYHICLDLKCFSQPAMANAGIGISLEPHLTATSTATKAVFPLAG